MYKTLSLLSTGFQLASLVILPRANRLQSSSPVLRRAFVRFQSSGLPSTTTARWTTEEHVDHLDEIVSIVESLLADGPLMKMLKIPRSFPFLEEKQRLEERIIDQYGSRKWNYKSEPFKFQKHLLNLSYTKFGLSEFVNALNKGGSEGFEALERYVSKLSFEQLRILKNSVLCACENDGVFFSTYVYPLVSYVNSESYEKLNKNMAELYDPTSIYETMIPSYIHHGDFRSAIYYHKKFIALINRMELKVNWLPVILTSILAQSMEALHTLMIIHFTLDLEKDGFFEYIVPFLSYECKDSNDLVYLTKWVNVLLRLGDFPKSSEPHLTNFLQTLLTNKFDKSVLSIFLLLRSQRSLSKINNGAWSSDEFINTLMKCINFTQTKDQVLFINEFIEMFDKCAYIHDPAFWYELIDTARFQDGKTFDRAIEEIQLLMARFGVNDSYDIYSVTCMKSPDNETFLKNFDTLINRQEVLKLEGKGSFLPSKVLGVFLKVLISFQPDAADSSTDSRWDDKETQTTELIDESFSLFKGYIDGARLTAEKDQRSFVALCYELTKGFASGLMKTENASRYQKLHALSRIESVIYDALESISFGKDNFCDRQLLKMELQIIRFRLSIGQLEEALERLDTLLDSLGSNSRVRIDPAFSRYLVKVLDAEIAQNLKYLNTQQFDADIILSQNNNNLTMTLKALFRISKMNKDSVIPKTWSHLLVCVSRVRPFEELQYLLGWLVSVMMTQPGNKIKLKTSHILHPLNILLNDKTLAKIIRLSFTMTEGDGPYEPWKTLELILKISDSTGIFLNVPKIKKAIKWGLDGLYVHDYDELSISLKRARHKNRLNGPEMIEKFNEVWKTDYYVKESEL